MNDDYNDMVLLFVSLKRSIGFSQWGWHRGEFLAVFSGTDGEQDCLDSLRHGGLCGFQIDAGKPAGLYFDDCDIRRGDRLAVFMKPIHLDADAIAYASPFDPANQLFLTPAFRKFLENGSSDERRVLEFLDCRIKRGKDLRGGFDVH